jgi:hypothetical protein
VALSAGGTGVVIYPTALLSVAATSAAFCRQYPGAAGTGAGRDACRSAVSDADWLAVVEGCHDRRCLRGAERLRVERDPVPGGVFSLVPMPYPRRPDLGQGKDPPSIWKFGCYSCYPLVEHEAHLNTFRLTIILETNGLVVFYFLE